MNKALGLTALLSGIAATGMICFILARQNNGLRQDVGNLNRQVTRLEAVLSENAELRNQLSRQRAADMELERLREEASEVYRLRGQVGELRRLRREYGEMVRYVIGLTNRLDQLLHNNRQLALQVGELSMYLRQVGEPSSQSLPEARMQDDPWAVWDGEAWVLQEPNATMEPGSRAAPGDANDSSFDSGGFDIPRRPPPGTITRLPPNHPLTSESCISCHSEDVMTPQLFGSVRLGQTTVRHTTKQMHRTPR
jgi:chaperonin cofactor prefoldin